MNNSVYSSIDKLSGIKSFVKTSNPESVIFLNINHI
jgi:hypothetical protein